MLMALVAVKSLQSLGRPVVSRNVLTTTGGRYCLQSSLNCMQARNSLSTWFEPNTVMMTRRTTQPVNSIRCLSSSCNQDDHQIKVSSSPSASSPSPPEPSDSSRPSEAQLAEISTGLSNNLPAFFSKPHNFRLYNRGIVFEDNIRNVRTAGLNQYAWEIAKIKMGAHFKYGRVNLELLKLTYHVEDGTIRLRWRIIAYPGNQIILAFWKFKTWKLKESIAEAKDHWIDGFSIFHVGGDGLIYKHVADKVIPDTDQVKSKKDVSNMAIKVAIALGLIPAGEEALGDAFWSWILTNL